MESKEIFLVCAVIFLFVSAFATAFDGSAIEFESLYLYEASDSDKTPKNVFFIGGDDGEVPALRVEPAGIPYTMKLMDAETRDKLGDDLSHAAEFPGNYTLRVTAIDASENETIREISFTAIPKGNQINIPETHEFMVLGFFLAVIAIITKHD